MEFSTLSVENKREGKDKEGEKEGAAMMGTSCEKGEHTSKTGCNFEEVYHVSLFDRYTCSSIVWNISANYQAPSFSVENLTLR